MGEQATATLEGHHAIFHGTLSEQPSAERLLAVLLRLVTETGLHAICEPLIHQDGEQWAAFVMIAESHISFEGRGRRAMVDVVSCRDFDDAAMQGILQGSLGGEWLREKFRRDFVHSGGAF